MPEDATATYRGYRNQALYVLARVLTDADAENCIYRPEGIEDLAVFDARLNLVEVVQVKDHSGNLALSHFKPSSTDGFFRRLKARRIAHPNCVTRLATFGALGPELSGGIAGNALPRESLVTKIHDGDPSITKAEAEEMLDALRGCVMQVVAAELNVAVLTAIEGTIAGGHTSSTMELLMYWVFDASENKRDITRKGLLLQLERIGAYLAALRDTSHEWGISLRPIRGLWLAREDLMRLRREYRQGIQAKWEHILADADCVRLDRLQEIHKQFQLHSTVIVRGASGQGKSTLGWRYLRDYCAEGLRFHVRLVEGREHAVRIANALRSHVQRLHLNAVVYLDLSPSDTGWPDLVRELTLSGLKVLVTVREEDFRRAGIAVGDFDYSEVVLEGVTRCEAQPIYASLREEHTSSVTLDFEEAWARFSAYTGGPLLEFTHLVTEGESLASRITAQISRLQRDASAEKNGVTSIHLELLALAAIANAASARVDLLRLCAAVGINPITHPLAVLENEYLLRVQGDGGTSSVAGLHALRSHAVMEALLRDCPELRSSYVKRCLPLIVDADVEGFLLAEFARHPEHSELIESELRGLSLRSWTHAGGIARALLWEGVSRYEGENQETILGAISKYDSAWWMACDTFIGLGDHAYKELHNTLDDIFHGNLQPIELTPKEHVFTPFKKWALSVAAPAKTPTSSLDWVRAGDIAYWIAHCGIDGELRLAADALLPVPLPPGTSLREFALFVSGRERLGDEAFYSWHSKQQATLIDFFLRETDSVHIADDGTSIKVFFSIPIADSITAGNPDANDWHGQTMKRVRLLRLLFPHRKMFGAQGLGLEVLSELIQHDPTTKNIAAKDLPPERAIQLNSVFGSLVSYRHQRSNTWTEYATAVLAFRHAVSDCFRQLYRGWARLLAESSPKRNTVMKLPGKELDQIKKLSKLPMFPRTVVDEWGFSSETKDVGNLGEINNPPIVGLQRFDPWRKAFRDFESGISMVLSKIVGLTKLYLDEHQGHAETEADAKNGHLLLVNLGCAWEALVPMQSEFRRCFRGVFSPRKLDELDKHERSNFRHFWAVAFAMCYERHRHVESVGYRIQAEIAERRRCFLDAIVSEVSTVLGDAGTVAVKEEPWIFNETQHLCITCDHQSLATLATLRAEVVAAIWRAAQLGGWRNLEWQPIVVEWPKIAVLHLVRGRALEMACATLSTMVIFATQDTFEVHPYHLFPMSVSSEAFSAGGFLLWENPLLRAVINMQSTVIAFVLTNVRFYPLAKVIFEHSLGEEATDRTLTCFSRELTTVLNVAQRSYTELVLLLDTLAGEHILRWKNDLHRLCKIRLLEIDPNAEVSVNMDNFPAWIEQVDATNTEFDQLVTAIMSFAVESPS